MVNTTTKTSRNLRINRAKQAEDVPRPVEVKDARTKQKGMCVSLHPPLLNVNTDTGAIEINVGCQEREGGNPVKPILPSLKSVHAALTA